MERTAWPAFQNVGGGLVELCVQLAEVVVDGGGTEHAHPATFSLLELEPLRLYDDAEALHEEYAAEYGQLQFLMDDHCSYANNAADGQ